MSEKCKNVFVFSYNSTHYDHDENSVCDQRSKLKRIPFILNLQLSVETDEVTSVDEDDVEKPVDPVEPVEAVEAVVNPVRF